MKKVRRKISESDVTLVIADKDSLRVLPEKHTTYKWTARSEHSEADGYIVYKRIVTWKRIQSVDRKYIPTDDMLLENDVRDGSDLIEVHFWSLIDTKGQ